MPEQPVGALVAFCPTCRGSLHPLPADPGVLAGTWCPSCGQSYSQTEMAAAMRQVIGQGLVKVRRALGHDVIESFATSSGEQYCLALIRDLDHHGLRWLLGRPVFDQPPAEETSSEARGVGGGLVEDRALKALRELRATSRPGGPARQAAELGIAALEAARPDPVSPSGLGWLQLWLACDGEDPQIWGWGTTPECARRHAERRLEDTCKDDPDELARGLAALRLGRLTLEVSPGDEEHLLPVLLDAREEVGPLLLELRAAARPGPHQALLNLATQLDQMRAVVEDQLPRLSQMGDEVTRAAGRAEGLREAAMLIRSQVPGAGTGG